MTALRALVVGGVMVLVGFGPALAQPGQPAQSGPPVVTNPEHSAITPVPRADGWWTARHESMNQRVKQGGADLVFIGDSITQGWEGEGKDEWAKRYGPRHAVNLGIGGDRTQHVLWRLDHGNLDGIAPKVAVVMIGTNNSNGSDNTAAEIADGVKKIVAKVQEKSPSTRVLLLAIFPRGDKADNQRNKLAQVNAMIKELDDGARVRFLDIGQKFLAEDGSLPRTVMPDLLHLSPSGYEIWGAAMEPLLAEMLKAAEPSLSSP